MRKVVMYCDRCQKKFEKWNHKKPELYGVAEIVHDSGVPYLDEQKDLCESCYTELVKWWKFSIHTSRKGVDMTAEEIIADERYHTCGRCRWEKLGEDFYPCNECNHSADKRKDYWEYVESDEESEE